MSNDVIEFTAEVALTLAETVEAGTTFLATTALNTGPLEWDVLIATLVDETVPL